MASVRGSAHWLAREDGIRSASQIVGRNIRPPLSESSILIIDPAAIEELTLMGKNGGLGERWLPRLF